jgi:hypothetical protein
LQRALRGRSPPDAIVASNSHQAALVLAALRAIEVATRRTCRSSRSTIPEWSRLVVPSLSVVRQPAAAMAQAAFDLLMLRVECARRRAAHRRARRGRRAARLRALAHASASRQQVRVRTPAGWRTRPARRLGPATCVSGRRSGARHLSRAWRYHHPFANAVRAMASRPIALTIDDENGDGERDFGRPAPGWRRRAHDVVFRNDSPAGRAFDVALMVVILASVLVVMLDSVPWIAARYRGVFHALEWIFTAFFTVEYVVRLACVRRSARVCAELLRHRRLLAVLPTYISTFVPELAALIDVRVLRLLRVFRVLKLGSTSTSSSSSRRRSPTAAARSSCS